MKEPSGKLWFTSDTHFNHANIIKYCSRPFADVEAMNAEMIHRWNDRVQPEDVVLHMGDFALGKAEAMPPIFGQLNGYKHLIRGNHDSKKTTELGWVEVLSENMVKTELGTFYCVHNPAAAQGWLKKGTVVIHGHLHGTMDLHPFPKKDGLKYVDAGVDCWDYRPVSLEDLLARAA